MLIAAAVGVATTIAALVCCGWLVELRDVKHRSILKNRHSSTSFGRRAMNAAVVLTALFIVGAPQAAVAGGSQGYFGIHWQAHGGYYACTSGSGHIDNQDNNVLNLNTTTISYQNGCSIRFVRPATWIWVKEDVYFNNGSSGWTSCNIGPWINNGSSSDFVMTGWTPRPLPCGPGFYYVQGWHDIWDPALGYTGGGWTTPSIYAT